MSTVQSGDKDSVCGAHLHIAHLQHCTFAHCTSHTLTICKTEDHCRLGELKTCLIIKLMKYSSPSNIIVVKLYCHWNPVFCVAKFLTSLPVLARCSYNKRVRRLNFLIRLSPKCHSNLVLVSQSSQPVTVCGILANWVWKGVAHLIATVRLLPWGS